MKFNKIFQEYLNLAKPTKTTIHWYDLYEGHYLKLEPYFQKQLFNQAVEKAGDYSKLGRKLNIGRKTISGCYNLQINPQIKVLKKVAEYLNYHLEDINNKIIKVAGLIPNFPFNLDNQKGAEIIAAFISDGHVDKNPTALSQYCAYEKELHTRLINLCNDIFGDFKTKTYFNSRSHITKFPSPIGDSLDLVGIPRGNKTLKNFYLPRYILLGDKDIQTSYLRRVFDDEGDVCFDNCGKRAVRMTRSLNIGDLDINLPSEKWTRYKLPTNIQHNLIMGEQILLLNLGIDAKLYPEGVYKSKNGNITAKWRIQIGQQDQIRKFAELINFNLDLKREKLNNILSSYKQRQLPNGKGKEEALKFIRNTFKEQGFITFGDLGKEMVRTERSYDLAGMYLKYFQEKCLIRKVKRGVYEFINDNN